MSCSAIVVVRSGAHPTSRLIMASVAFEITVILLLLVLNRVFAMSEMAVVASRKVRLKPKAVEV